MAIVKGGVGGGFLFVKRVEGWLSVINQGRFERLRGGLHRQEQNLLCEDRKSESREKEKAKNEKDERGEGTRASPFWDKKVG